TRNGNVRRDTERYRGGRAVAAVDDVPGAVRRTIDREIRRTIAVVITRNVYVAGRTEAHVKHAAAGQNARPRTAAVNRKIGGAVAVIIGRSRRVAGFTIRREDRRTRLRKDIPGLV